VEAFTTLHEAQVLVEDWRIEYNTVRPHSAWATAPQPIRQAWTTN
jgi:putative transposase